MINKYVKKPVTIEAIEFTEWTVKTGKYGDAKGHNSMDICKFMGLNSLNTHFDKKAAYIIIHTLEGDHRADVGDFIIKGIKGEFYPCKPDIFHLTYSIKI